MPASDKDWYDEKIDSILLNKTRGLSTAELETQIDEKLFDAYKLTDAERSLILSGALSNNFSEKLIKEISLAESE